MVNSMARGYTAGRTEHLTTESLRMGGATEGGHGLQTVAQSRISTKDSTRTIPSQAGANTTGQTAQCISAHSAMTRSKCHLT